MKKQGIIIIVLTISIVCFLLFLSTYKSKPFYLEDKYYNGGSLIEISKEELNALEERKGSFVVFVYNPGACCTSTVNFDSFLTDFVKTEKIDFFTISFNEIDKTSIAKHVKYYPTVVIFNKGKITAYLDAESDNDLYYYESIAGFKEWFSKYVYLK